MLLRARVLDASGDWLSAQRLADAVSRACPEDPQGALLGARISLDRLGNASDALQRCVEALERMKGSVDLQELGGEALLALGRLEEARAVWSALVERDPGRTSAIKFLARESAAERLWDEAIGWLDRIPASEQGPDDLALAWQAAWELGERERGLATAQELAARRPGSEEAALMLARSLAAVGRTADALAEADRWLPAHAMPHAAATGAAAAGAPAADGESDARVTAGLFALRGALRAAAAAGDASATDAALADLRAALVADPDNLDALHAIASLLERSGDLRAALGYLKHVYELAPDGALHERVLGLESRLEGAK